MEQWLASEETGEPFRHCVACRFPLLELDSPWLVNKEFEAEECVLEYAVCGVCRDTVASTVPDETKARVRAFLHAEIDWATRIGEFLADVEGTGRFEKCVCCLTPRSGLDGFAVSGMFDSGGILVQGPLPVLICRTCMQRLADLLCETTRRIWQDFLRQHLADPPDSGSGLWW